MPIIPILILAFAIIHSLEKVFSNKWIQWYYNYGIPLYYSRGFYDINGLPQKYDVQSYGSNIDMKRCSIDRYFFRKGGFKKVGMRMFEYSPLRGHISLIETSREYKIVYFLNWHIFIFLVILIIIVLTISRGVYLSPFILLIMGSIVNNISRIQIQCIRLLVKDIV
jgi:hypothetical protein